MLISTLSERDRVWCRERTELLFGGLTVVSRGVVHTPSELPGFIAIEGPERFGVATFHVDGDRCELVTLDALCQWRGVGSALLQAVEQAARAAECREMWLITTNDNVDGLRFFQRRGYRIEEVRVGGIAATRELKPELPRTGFYDIEIRDEIDLVKPLGEGEGWSVPQS